MLVSTQGLSVRLGGHRVLHHVDMSVARGEIVTIVGPNGSGKSTLLRTLIGAVKPSTGSVQRADGLTIGYVPQRLFIDDTLPMTVARFLSLPDRKRCKKVAVALEQAGVEGLDKRQVMDLSGGQFQRVLLARALLNSPDLLLLDEATQGLDQRGSAAFYRQIEQVRQTLNCGVLLISHELHVVMRATDRVICLNGHVCCHGTPETVTSTPEYQSLFGLDDSDAFATYPHPSNAGPGLESVN